MKGKATGEQCETAAALLSAILHRLEVRGIVVSDAEYVIWSAATDLLQGCPVMRLDTGAEVSDARIEKLIDPSTSEGEVISIMGYDL